MMFNRFNHTRFFFDESISSFEVKARAHLQVCQNEKRNFGYN